MTRAKLIALALSSFASCRYDPLIEEFNDLPVADARVIRMGEAVEQARDGSIAALTFPFTGEPVAITLDGTNSRDPNGEIKEYRWLSGTRISDAALPRPWSIDAGAPRPFLRALPSGEELGWPANGPTVTVQLGEGIWAFTLWVVDDEGAWSSPDTIRFIVGNPPQAGDAGAGVLIGGLDAGVDASAPRP